MLRGSLLRRAAVTLRSAGVVECPAVVGRAAGDEVLGEAPCRVEQRIEAARALVLWCEREAGQARAGHGDALDIVVEVAADEPAHVGRPLAEATLDQQARRLRLGDADGPRPGAALHAVAPRTHRLEVREVERGAPSTDAQVHLQEVAAEHAVVPLDADLPQRRVVQVEVVVGDVRVRAHLEHLDGRAVAGRAAGDECHVDAAGVVALDHVALGIVEREHRAEIAVAEGVQRVRVLDLLQAQDVGVGVRDGEGCHLPRVVGMRDDAGLLQCAELLLGLNVHQGERTVASHRARPAGEVEAGEKVLDVERGDADRHAVTPLRAWRCRPARGSCLSGRGDANRHGRDPIRSTWRRRSARGARRRRRASPRAARPCGRPPPPSGRGTGGRGSRTACRSRPRPDRA